MRRLFAYRNRLFGANAPYVLLARYSHSNAIATAELLPLPNNIDVAETTRFSPRRNRDISANAILTHKQTEASSSFHNNFRMNNDSSTVVTSQDRHLQSYDCFGTIRLNSAMQSNVPSPFSSGMDMVTHLNMPQGQLAQESKFMSQNLHNSHYTALRNKARADWSTYDKDATIQNRQHKRTYCSKAAAANKDAAPPPVLTKKEQLKKAFKDYGSTIVIFHVGISLVSLGSFYFLVNNGIDVIGLLDQLGYAPAALKSSVAAGASSFVVAYAIHKIFAPVRISITLGAAPFIVRYMRSKGLLKPKATK